MKRIIYSLYIDIPENMLDDQPAYNWDVDKISKTKKTKI